MTHTDRRQDEKTAALVREALKMQRSIGFEPAFLMLRAHDVDAELARTLLCPYLDRRIKERRNLETRPDQVE